MKFFKFMFFVGLLFFYACNSDSILTEREEVMADQSISGRVQVDMDGDSIGDSPFADATILYGTEADVLAYQNGDSILTVLTTLTDADGAYIFEGLPPDSNKVVAIFNYSISGFVIVKAEDATPDPDGVGGIGSQMIPVDLDEDEMDEDNNFVLSVPIGMGTISGRAMLDTDGDGIGDEPMANEIVLLGQEWSVNVAVFNIGYHDLTCATINTDDYPIDPNLRITCTDENGNYVFEEVIEDNGGVIGIGLSSNEYNISGVDGTPDGDAMELDTGRDVYVQVIGDEVDDGNDFLVRIIPTKIRGVVTQDTTSDGHGDLPVQGARFRLFHYDENTDELVGAALDEVYSDADGVYEFIEPEPGNYMVVGDVLTPIGLSIVRAMDTSVDPDGGEIIFDHPNWIRVVLSPGETDDDNDFLYAQFAVPNIRGRVLEDTNNDGLGDTPLQGHRVELYKRSDTGVPQGPIVADDFSNVGGYFSFHNVDPGEYVIYYIGIGPYECVSNMDLSPEPGEPTNHPTCFFIQVDITSEGQLDDGNEFVVIME